MIIESALVRPTRVDARPFDAPVTSTSHRPTRRTEPLRGIEPEHPRCVRFYTRFRPKTRIEDWLRWAATTWHGALREIRRRFRLPEVVRVVPLLDSRCHHDRHEQRPRGGICNPVRTRKYDDLCLVAQRTDGGQRQTTAAGIERLKEPLDLTRSG